MSSLRPETIKIIRTIHNNCTCEKFVRLTYDEVIEKYFGSEEVLMNVITDCFWCSFHNDLWKICGSPAETILHNSFLQACSNNEGKLLSTLRKSFFEDYQSSKIDCFVKTLEYFKFTKIFYEYCYAHHPDEMPVKFLEHIIQSRQAAKQSHIEKYHAEIGPEFLKKPFEERLELYLENIPFHATAYQKYFGKIPPLNLIARLKEIFKILDLEKRGEIIRALRSSKNRKYKSIGDDLDSISGSNDYIGRK